MGRTLHFSIKKVKGSFTKVEQRKLYDLSTKYNSGKFEKFWTCENFFVGANYYPNWSYFHDNNIDTSNAWDYIDSAYKKIEKEHPEFHPVDIFHRMHKMKLVYFNEFDTNEVNGFVKTQGNELNSLMVVAILGEISTKLRNVEINLDDEGHLLLCPIIIKNGKSVPNLTDMKENINRLAARVTLGKESSILEKLDLPAFDTRLGEDMGLDNPYGESMLKYLQEEFDALKEIEDIVKEHHKNDGSLICDFNIERNMIFPLMAFVREVDPQDFEDVEVSAKTLMAGFGGEYWNIDKNYDAESESYKALGFVQSMLKDHIPEDAKISILGEE